MQDASYSRSAMTSRGRGQQGTLEQLDDGRWRARYRVDGRDGKRPQKTFAANRKREAAQWLRDRVGEVEAARDGDGADLILRREADRTVEQTIEDYLAAHDAAAPTLGKLRYQLEHARRAFGSRALQSLEPFELQAWRKTLAPGVRHYATRSFKQVLAQAERWHWLDANPFDGIPNPRPRRTEVRPPSWEHVELLADEIDERYAAVPIFAAGTGLRVEEWLALRRADVDLDAGVVRVRYVYSSGVVTELGADGSKSWRQRRDVPLRAAVRAALARLVPRIDTPLLFPAPAGGYMNAERFRERFWIPAARAAGLAHPFAHRRMGKEAKRASAGWRPEFSPKDLRHVYASESIAAGVDLFTLSRFMGTSLREIDDTYGHLVGDANARNLELLDAYDGRNGR